MSNENCRNTKLPAMFRTFIQGVVFAWGKNTSGQLGDGTDDNKFVPVQVSNSTGLTGVVAIAAGTVHSLAIDSDNAAWAWGNNDSGQLGNNSNTTSNVPVQVCTSTGLTNVVAIAGGGSYSLAIDSDGAAWAWGNNNSGQLGDNSFTDSNVPVQVSTATGLTNVVTVAAGTSHSLAIDSDGVAWAWGFNALGQLGDNSFDDSDEPVQVSTATGLTNVVSIAGGRFHSLAIDSDGKAWAWGDNFFGQLGDNSTNIREEPVEVSTSTGLTNAVAIAAGDGHSLALKSDGTVWAWGRNNVGQLGDGTISDRIEPEQVLTNAVAIAAGDEHSLAIISDGTVWAWGLNDEGQLGNGINVNSNIPVQVSKLTGVMAIAGGFAHSLALTLLSDLSVKKSASPDPVKLGENVTYTITVTNNGPSTAIDVTITDILPEDVEVISLPMACTEVDGIVTCDLGTLDPNQSTDVTIVVKPNTTGTFCNRVTVSGHVLDDNSVNNEALKCVSVSEFITQCTPVVFASHQQLGDSPFEDTKCLSLSDAACSCEVTDVGVKTRSISFNCNHVVLGVKYAICLKLRHKDGEVSYNTFDVCFTKKINADEFIDIQTETPISIQDFLAAQGACLFIEPSTLMAPTCEPVTTCSTNVQFTVYFDINVSLIKDQIITVASRPITTSPVVRLFKKSNSCS